MFWLFAESHPIPPEASGQTLGAVDDRLNECDGLVEREGLPRSEVTTELACPSGGLLRRSPEAAITRPLGYLFLTQAAWQTERLERLAPAPPILPPISAVESEIKVGLEAKPLPAQPQYGQRSYGAQQCHPCLTTILILATWPHHATLQGQDMARPLVAAMDRTPAAVAFRTLPLARSRARGRSRLVAAIVAPQTAPRAEAVAAALPSS